MYINQKINAKPGPTPLIEDKNKTKHLSMLCTLQEVNMHMRFPFLRTIMQQSSIMKINSNDHNGLGPVKINGVFLTFWALLI